MKSQLGRSSPANGTSLRSDIIKAIARGDPLPFCAEKNREVTKGKDLKKRDRREYAAIVNGVSSKTGGPAIYDPRSYTDRKVDLSPSKHLGQLHASKIAGIPTIIGLDNERNQANDARRSISARHKEEEARLSALDLN